jgi:hypothetical protein
MPPVMISIWILLSLTSGERIEASDIFKSGEINYSTLPDFSKCLDPYT